MVPEIFIALIQNARRLVVLVLLAFTAPAVRSQDNKQKQSDTKQDALEQQILSKRFIFSAQSATPANGRSRDLTTGYGLSMKNDTLEVYLPFYGRAYVAPIGGDDGGIKFTTKDFDYVSRENKHHAFTITIRPHGIDAAQRITMSISSTGYTTVQVSSNSRDMISFYGTINM